MASNAEILRLLHGKNIYEGFDLAAWPPDFRGWGADHPLLGEALETVRPSLVVEVGSWKGASAMRLAQGMKSLGLDGTIVCVDTWLGGVEHFLGREQGQDFFASLSPLHGYPRLYWQFLANVVHGGHQDVIVPLPQTSFNAARILAAFGLRPQFVYIDASHEFVEISFDLRFYWDLLADDGVLVGDDFHPQWPGVVNAVRSFAAEKGLALHVDGQKYVLHKPAARRLPSCRPADPS